MPSNEVAPSSRNGHPTRDLKSSRGTGLNAKLAQENAQLVQENAQLMQERDLLRTLIDSLPDRIFVKDRQSRFLINNPAHVLALGATCQDEVIGKTDRDIFPAELANQYYGDEQALMESGQPLNREEMTVMPRTDKKYWLQTTKVPLRDKQGAVVGLVGISRDVTDLKRAEEALVQERSLLRTLIDNLPDGVYIKDTAGRKTMVNPADLKVLGCKTEAEAIGKSDFDLFPKDIAEKFWADDQKVIQGQPLLNREEYVLNDAGEKRWLLTSKLPLRDQNGKITGLVGMGRDITEQKRTEEALRQAHDELEKRVAERTAELSRERLLLRTLIDNLPDYVYAKDAEGQFVIANVAVAHQMGFSSPNEIIGKSDFDLFPQELAERYRAEELEMMQSGQALCNHEGPTMDKSKEEKNRWVSTTKVILRDAQGKATGFIGLGQDITERKQVEESLNHERILLRTLIDNLPDHIYAKDKQGHFVLNNMAHAHGLGAKSPEELKGKSDFDFFHPEVAAQFHADEQKIIETGQPLLNQEQYKCLPGETSGQKSWSVSTKVLWHDAQGEVLGTVGITRDITEQKRTEAKLEYEQQLFQTLLETTPDNMYFKDRESRFVRVSQSKVETTLQTVRKVHRTTHPADNPDEWPPHMASTKAFAEWLIGKTDFDTFPKEHARAAFEDEQEIIRTGEPTMGKLQKMSLPDGTNTWYLTTKMPWRDKDGNIIGTFGVSRNVTKLKEAEESLNRERVLLRTVIDNLPDFIYAKDKQGHFVLNNIAHAHDLGSKSPEEMKGKSDFDYFPPELAKQFYADEQKIIETGQTLLNQEQYKCRPSDKSGQKRWSVSTKVLWRDAQGAVLGTVGVTRDIHEIKLVQEALRQSEEKLRQFTVQLERSNRELQDFAYVASHDLQEPLRKIVVFGERLKEKNSEALGPDALDYLDRMQKAAARMQILINDLLTFSRVTTKAHPFAPVNLAEIASEVVNDLEGRIELVKGRVELGTLPVIDAEALQMRQLLQNLIGNALKFRRPEEPPVVKVEAQIIPDPITPTKKLCRLTVSDNCIGFDEKYLDRIFNVFQRLHTRNEYEGTGMGLAIVRKIALYHGGDITAKSKPGEGSTFILTIPVIHPKKAQDEIKETTTNKENQP
jgi:PAS domain S-box-containing protein